MFLKDKIYHVSLSIELRYPFWQIFIDYCYFFFLYMKITKVPSNIQISVKLIKSLNAKYPNLFLRNSTNISKEKWCLFIGLRSGLTILILTRVLLSFYIIILTKFERRYKILIGFQKRKVFGSWDYYAGCRM